MSLAAQVPGGFTLSPGEALEGLAEVSVGLDGLYGLESPGGVGDEREAGRTW